LREFAGAVPRAPEISLPRRKSEVLAPVVPDAACRSLVATSVRVSTPARSVEDGEPELMNRRCAGSNTIPDSREGGVTAPPAAAPPAAIVRIMRAGGAAADACVGNDSRDEFLKFFHFSPSATCTRSNTPRCDTGKIPSRKFVGVFPCVSKGCVGTSPTCEPERTHVAVTGLQEVVCVRPKFPVRVCGNDPVGVHTHPRPG